MKICTLSRIKRSVKSLCLLIIALLPTHTTFATNNGEVAVFITIGQSNADGSAFFDPDEDARLRKWYTSDANKGNLKIWYRSTYVVNQPANTLGEKPCWVFDGKQTDINPGWLDLWYRNENLKGRTAMNMIHGCGTYSPCAQARRGMEGEFGMRFAQAFPDMPLYIIKLGVSGSHISSWANEIDNHNWDYFYQQVYKPAIADLLSKGLRPRLAGIWWMQGCADKDKSQEYYEECLRGLINKCREQLGFKECRFFIGHILAPGENANHPNGSVDYSQNVRAAQDHVAATTEGVEIIETHDCEMQYEQNFNGYIHFSHKGVNTIGAKLATRLAATSPTSWPLLIP